MDAADKYSGPNSLYKAKATIRQLKADIKSMDVVLGANSAMLTGKQLSRQQAGKKIGLRFCRYM